ncbi:MAG: hypothetical protein NTZ35_14945, partial [Ignavibacteriales bacterium]|nr:hypothetical protein [Ignavibacteriales bacterium]
MRTFAICSLLFVASVGVISTVPSISRLCSGGDDDEPSRPAFLFDPELTGEPEYRPLYFTWNKYYDNGWLNDSCTHNSNLFEWRRHFGNNVTLWDIGRVIYNSTLEEVRHIDKYVKGESADLNDTLRQNVLVQHMKETGDLPFASYLLFAKRCEPYVTDFDRWDPEGSVARVKDSLLALLKEGKIFYDSCPSEFIKLRYGYQLVRLAHYSRQLEECRDIYDRYVEPSKVESIMRYWALEQKAGALRKLGLEAESSYLFSLVFDRCPSRRETSFSSFRITSDSAWNVCLSLCRTPKERTTLFFLRGMRPQGNAVEEMRNMYEVDPTSAQLNILLVRELNKFENDLLQLTPKENVAFYETYESFEEGKKEEVQSLRSLKEFVDRCVHEARVKNLDLWRLALAYMEYMTAKYDEAQGMLERLKNTTSNDSIRKQIGLFQLAVEITRLRQIDDVTEDGLFRRVLDANHEKLKTLSINTFEKLCEMKGDSIKAYLCNHDLRDLQVNLDLELVDRILDWRIHKVKTSLDGYLVYHRLDYPDAGYEYGYGYYEMRGDGLVTLKELKGTILLGQNRLKEAMGVFRQIPEAALERLRADPFKGRIKDCRDCDFAEKSEKPYNKLSLTLSILELLDKIKNDPKRAAEYHFLLGNAYYNMTHFGNAAEATIYDRNADLWFGGIASEFQKTKTLPFYLDCSRALQHYDTAMKLAEASGDLELASKCCFMAAKCEQNRYYVTVTGYDEKWTIKNS